MFLGFLFSMAFIFTCFNMVNYTPLESEGDALMFFANLMIAVYFGYMSIGKFVLSIV